MLARESSATKTILKPVTENRPKFTESTDDQKDTKLYNMIKNSSAGEIIVREAAGKGSCQAINCQNDIQLLTNQDIDLKDTIQKNLIQSHRLSKESKNPPLLLSQEGDWIITNKNTDKEKATATFLIKGERVEVTVWPDGRRRSLYPNGKVVDIDSNERQRTTYPGGRIETLWPNGRKLVEVHGHRFLYETDGREVTTHKNGTVFIEYPEGGKEVQKPDGRILVYKKDGRKIQTWPDGRMRIVYPNGQIDVKLPDRRGSPASQRRRWFRNADGRSVPVKHLQEEKRMRKKANGRRRPLPEKPKQ